MTPASIHRPHILAIEDDVVLGAFVHDQLDRCGFQVTWCQNGAEGLACAQREPFDVVLMDILLPGMNGLDILTHLRRRHTVPIILMSALGAEADRITGFQNGADDYLPKPFSVDELRVRIEAILRRVELERRFHALTAHEPDAGAEKPEEDGLTFDDGRCDVFFAGSPAQLTGSEYRLLDTLWRNQEDVLSKAFLYQHVLQRGYSQHDRSLDMHISQIRRKLKAVGYQARQLRTVWGKGYVLTAAVQDA
ncbi:response regulator transcription factor [Pseudomonas sp. PS02290]|uniref:response regulator transcription factor n=1 Tax=Pseudomonas sp. PS02290 TaxID=2991430 RepID=UPI002499DB07|nr:response regulator transcription factor [Pseudomonas sp. PS02290]